MWKNGICWGDESGVEALVEVKENKSVVVMLRCLKESQSESEVECARVQSTVIDKIQQIRETFCPKVTVSENLLHHSDCKEYPTKLLSELALINTEDIAAAVRKHKPCIVDEAGQPILLSEILGFEPYTSLGVSILQQLFGDRISIYSKNVSVADRPTLLQLLGFSCAKKQANIPVEIGTKYIEFGTLILQDTSGAKVKNLEHKYQRDAERINTEIFREWLNGEGKQPVTWATLIEVLHDIELSSLAKDISGVLYPTTEQ